MNATAAAFRQPMMTQGGQQQSSVYYDPWSPPDTFTVYNFAPDYVKPYLHPHWQTQKAVHPIWAYFFGLYYLVMGFFFLQLNCKSYHIHLTSMLTRISGSMAIAGNAMVLKIFSRYNNLRTPANLLVINLAISDLMLMITLIPEAVYNFFNGGPWQFGDIGCQIHAFCGALFGYSQITTLTSKFCLVKCFK